MGGLDYRPDWLAARERLTTWWNGGSLGRAVLLMTARRAAPPSDLTPRPAPAGWLGRYSMADPDYSIHLARWVPATQEYFGEACPNWATGDLAPGCVALYLGCRGVEMQDTTWLEPCLESPAGARFELDPTNRYWRWTCDQIAAVAPLARGRFLQAFPDLIEGLDVLAALRGTDHLLLDLLDRPEWVAASLARLTDLYFAYYDRVYEAIRDEVGGSHFWAWAPGRLAKLQCDFSAMISPQQFRDLMLPVLTDMTARLGYSMYHLDGLAAARAHLDALLELPRLQMVQWTAGAGHPGTGDPCWFPLYHRILDAGKKINLWAQFDQLPALRREFGAQSEQLLINLGVADAAQAAQAIRLMEG
ncbi:MAG: hypothetical protein IT204_19565 [Fimbriimonadaceae bacterium]|nr:hypothetical protein [Fimbriimonadaceae bacterium]